MLIFVLTGNRIRYTPVSIGFIAVCYIIIHAEYGKVNDFLRFFAKFSSRLRRYFGGLTLFGCVSTPFRRYFFFASLRIDVWRSSPEKRRARLVLCAAQVSTFIAKIIKNRHTTYAFVAIWAYFSTNTNSCITLKPETPKSEPSEPHSVRKIKRTTPIRQNKTISAHQPQSQGRQNQKSPSVEAIPLPPLKRVVTGKICPTMTKSPQK